ncbi:MAG: DMT family transporter [Pseudomonadota bacterium]
MSSSRTDNLPLAVTAIVISVLGLSLGDALIKFTSGSFVLWQVFVLRSLIVLPWLLAYLALRAPTALRQPTALGWTTLRGLMLVLMWIAYYLALPHLSIAAAAASFYTLPIFITLFSALFIGDRINVQGWIAVGLGFLGVVLILRPGVGDFNLYALLPLLSAVLYALSMILTRTKCRDADPIYLSFALNLGFLVVGSIAASAISGLSLGQSSGYMLGPWAEMTPENWLSLCLMGAAILVGSVGAAIAYQKGPPAIIGSFDFAYVGFAVFWGLLFFGHIPDLVTLGGIALIILAGLLSMRQGKARE